MDDEAGWRQRRLSEGAVSRGRSSVPQTYPTPDPVSTVRPRGAARFPTSEYRSIARENTVVCGIVEAGQEAHDENS